MPPIGWACPAIGYSSVAHIELSEPRAGVMLELCDGEGCAPGPAMAPVEAQEVRTTTAPNVNDTGVITLAGNGETG